MRRLFLFLCLGWMAMPATGQDYTFDVPQVVLNDVPFAVTLRSDDVVLDAANAPAYTARLGGQAYAMAFERDDDGHRRLIAKDLTTTASGPVEVELVQNGVVIARAATRSMPGWLSILPPLLAIIMALLFKRVIPALFLGVWVGAWMAVGLTGAGRGLLDAFQVYVQNTLVSAEHIAIILFSFMIGGMIGIISKNGGMQGIVNRIAGWASTAQKGQLATWMLGLVIFFDDYSNTLVVGNTMRAVTDRLKVSREKLAYIVDSTAAPVTSLFLVTTWIGFEVGIIRDSVAKIEGYNEAAYSIFLNSIPYSFYPWLAIFFVGAVAFSGRDYGPMRRAERRARATGAVLGPDARVDEAAAEGKELKPKTEKPQRALNAVIPIIVLVGGVIIGLLSTGEGASLRDIMGTADSYAALMWASLASVVVAAALTLGQRILTLGEVVEAWYAGLKMMLFAMIILILAWALSDVTGVLHTADYLVSILGEALTPGLVPFLIFVLSAATAFATGSSWSTIGILMPLVVPLTWAVLQANAVADPSHYYLIYSAVSCVLAGSVWGDHCSPISDTTILSSMASGCDHIDHVRTQLPYAVTVGFVAIVLGTVPTGFGFPWWISMLLGVAVLGLFLRFYGKKSEEVVVV